MVSHVTRFTLSAGLALAAITGSSTTPAQDVAEAGDGQTELAHLTFDGTASPGEIFTPDDGVAPGFVEGRSGKALAFGGPSVVAMPLNIDPREHPRLTIVAWIKIRPDAAGQPFLISTGEGPLPALKLVDRRLTGVAGRGRTGVKVQIPEQIPVDTWVRVAGVWDFDARSLRLHAGENTELFEDMRMSVSAGQVPRQRGFPRPDDPDGEKLPYVFIGASNFNLYNFPASGVAIDDVRVVSGALSARQIAALDDGAGAEADTADASEEPDAEGTPGADPIASATVGTYHVCSAAVGCASEAAQCFDLQSAATGASGSMCTRRCGSDADCAPAHGFTGACYQVDTGLAVCYQRCKAEGDCNYGNACTALMLPGGLTDHICMPVRQADAVAPEAGDATAQTGEGSAPPGEVTDKPPTEGSLTIRLSWDSDPGPAFVGDTCDGAGVDKLTYRLVDSTDREVGSSAGLVDCVDELRVGGLDPDTYVLELDGEKQGAFYWQTTCDSLVLEPDRHTIYLCDVHW
jgi:hypothetical protein